ncbi:MAG: hypothetical protein K0V04_27840 [Deltaproteobacteria bacterium]|nr:hypothetical protein [Deltaproteobacteria bacterium]
MKILYPTVVLLFAGCVPGSNELPTMGDEHASEDVDASAAAGAYKDAASPSSPALDRLEQFREPFLAAIESRVGYSTSDVAQAVDAARVKHSLSCLQLAGYTASSQDIEQLVVVDPNPAMTMLDSALDTVTAGQTDVEKIGIPEEHLAACLADAMDNINPRLMLSNLLEEATVEISDQLRTDPKMQAAFEAERSCVVQSGFDGQVLERFSDQEFMASEVVFSFLVDDLGRDDALEELAQLSAQRVTLHSSLQAIEDCADQRLSIERELVVAQQVAYLDAHPGFIDGVADAYLEALVAIAGELDR